MSQAWMVVSGKGGVGKSIITAALGVALAKRGISCVVMDTDMGLRNLDLILGLENMVVFDVLDVAQKECKLKSALIRDSKHPELSLLAASQMGELTDLDADSLLQLITMLKRRFSYILLDAPAGLGYFLNALAPVVDNALLVTTPDDVAIRDAERIVSLLFKQGKPQPMLVVNRVYPQLVRDGGMYSPRTVANLLDTPLLGYIPNDVEVLRAINGHESFMDLDCPARHAMDRISRRFLGEFVPMPDPDKARGLLRGRRS